MHEPPSSPCSPAGKQPCSRAKRLNCGETNTGKDWLTSDRDSVHPGNRDSVRASASKRVSFAVTRKVRLFENEDSSFDFPDVRTNIPGNDDTPKRARFSLSAFVRDESTLLDQTIDATQSPGAGMALVLPRGSYVAVISPACSLVY